VAALVADELIDDTEEENKNKRKWKQVEFPNPVLGGESSCGLCLDDWILLIYGIYFMDLWYLEALSHSRRLLG
jgi:hypothetical protein